MKILGQIENAQLENKSSDYSSGVVGRIWWNTTSGQIKLDDGTNIRALLRNDQKVIIGNSGTAAENTRLHRGAANLLQFLQGSDATAEGSLSTALNQISGRLENYTNAGKPAVGNAGRVAYISDLGHLLFDNGSAWLGTKVENYTNAGKPAFGNAGRVIYITDLVEVQVDTGSAWITLASGGGSSARVAALYDFVVGSAAQVTSGAATHSTIGAAITAASAGNTILILKGTFTETVTVSKELHIFGQGRGSVINGTVTFNSSSDYSGMHFLKVTDDITLDSGADGCIVKNIWLASGKTFTDNGSGNLLEAIQET